MSGRLFHRLPRRDLQAMRVALRALHELGLEWLDEEQRVLVQRLDGALDAGFASKDDDEVDAELLLRCVEFALLTCDTVPVLQLQKLLPRLRACAQKKGGG